MQYTLHSLYQRIITNFPLQERVLADFELSQYHYQWKASIFKSHISTDSLILAAAFLQRAALLTWN
jgi:hypothetical protein